MNRCLGLFWIIWRTFGCKGLIRRGWHETRRQVGAFRTHPKYSIDFSRDDDPSLYQPCADLSSLSSEIIETVLKRARRVEEGFYEAYGHEWRAFPRTEGQWHKHPLTGYEFAMKQWWKIPHLPAAADIKDIWEPARFGWIYDLVRAYAITGDDSYARVFHERLSAWQVANPPFYGVHWSCGQEIAIRSLAILYAADSLPLPPGEERVARERILRILGWSGERIADAIGYGLSQRNNHGISEACGLIHIGLRLQGKHPDAHRWMQRGTRLLEEQICDQFYVDGWYAQHSFTYMRLALEQALLAQRVLRSQALSLSQASLKRLCSSFELLVSIVDAHNGYVPNHGANDGGRVAPFSTAEYRDFRPVLTLAAIVLEQPLAADIQPDPEMIRWLTEGTVLATSARENGIRTGASGWASARVADAALFLMAPSYRHRPSHLDSLHLDIRFQGSEVITDAGTFAYNAPVPWKNPLASAVVHNGPILDGLEPAQRGPRFLWYSWPSALLLEATYDDGMARIVAEIPGRVRREIEIVCDKVRILDLALDPAITSMQVTWLLHPDIADREIVQADNMELIEAAEGHITGWFSPTYGLRLQSSAIRVRATRCEKTLQLETLVHCPS